MKLFSLATYLFLRLLHATVRVRHVRAENLEGTPQYILAFWHECVLMSLFCKWRKPITIMVSRSKDGAISQAVVERFGVDTVRGSSNRGATVALREILRDAQEGRNIAFTPDGPKGPRRIVKEGVVYAAKITGLPIVPFHFTAKSKKRLRSWDRMIVPRPLTRVVYVYGEPMVVPRDGDVEEWRLKIEIAMNELADEAEAEVNR